MRKEIISVPYAYKKLKSWYLKVFEIDLDKTPYFVQSKDYPLKQNTLLPIGIEINDDIIQGRTNTKFREYQINNFKTGLIKPLAELSDKVYHLVNNHPLHRETLVYSFTVNGQETVIFLYELFRQFIGYSEGICQYIFEHDMLDIFIDGQTITSENNKTTLSIQLNNLLNTQLVLNNEFISSMVSLLYDESLRSYWKEIQAHTIDNRNNFKFISPPYDSINLRASVLTYSDFDLITSIKDINFQKELPFDKIIIKHPSLKQSPKSTGKKTKTGKREVDMPKDFKFDNESNPPSKKKKASITIKKPGFRFGDQMEIIREKSDYSTGLGGKKVHTEFKLNDINLSMDKADKSGETTELKINDVNDEPSFDFTEIPKGLQHFCNAISLVSKVLDLDFSYDLLSFNKELKSRFKYINGHERLGVLVSFQSNPQINLVEIDTSDNRFVSTLIFKELNIKQDEFFDTLFNDLAKTGGKWNKDFLRNNCISDTIRHPKNITNEESLDEKERANITKSRIAKTLIKVLY